MQGLCAPRRLALALLAVLAFASHADTPASDAAPQESSDKAIVVLSVSHERDEPVNATFYLDHFNAQRRSLDSAIGDTYPPESDFDDRSGKLYILELNPGDHQVDTWRLWAGSRFEPAIMPRPLQFTVQKGDVVYIGNLHVRIVTGKKFLSIGSIKSVTPVVQDRSTTDIALAESRMPSLQGKVRIALLALGDWTVDGKTIRRNDPPMVPIFIPRK